MEAERPKFDSAANPRRIVRVIGDLGRVVHDATASPFGAVDEFLVDPFVDIRHPLQRLGLERR